MGFFPILRRYLASLPLLVVLPEPCSPHKRIELGTASKVSAVLEAPSNLTNSSWMILMTCCPGWMLRITSWPIAFFRTSSINCPTTLKLTSASNKASRTSRNESATLVSLILPMPRRFLKICCSLSVKASNIDSV